MFKQRSLLFAPVALNGPLQHGCCRANTDILLRHLAQLGERCLSGRRGFCCTVAAADGIESASRLRALFCGLGKTSAQILQVLLQRPLASAHFIDVDRFTFRAQLGQRQSVTFLGKRGHDPDTFARQSPQVLSELRIAPLSWSMSFAAAAS